jgi:succinate dehydrogenase / fumarate reductase, cytochrome b subunit
MIHKLFCTTIGKKYLMGVTGLIWAGFVFGHMAGNLLLFISPDLYNAYGHALTSGNAIYLIEAVLIGALAIHIYAGITLTRLNRSARSQAYAVGPNGQKGASLASKTMAPQGLLILAFFILHIATFKYGTYYETTVNGVVMRDLYRLVAEAFMQPAYVVWYIVSLLLLGLHLSHGVGSLFQSLGWRNEKSEPTLKKIGFIYAFVVSAGFIAQPVYMFLIASRG